MMLGFRALCLLLFLSLSHLLFSELHLKTEIDSLFTAANEFYKNEQYQEAIRMYNSILDKRYISSELFYNLANAYFKESQYGMSRYYYEKALMYTPYDAEILHNVNLLLENIPYDIGFGLPSEIEKVIFWLIHSDVMLYLTILSFLLVILTFYYWVKNYFFRDVKYFVPKVVSLFGMSLILIGIVYWIDSKNVENYCIVVKNTTFIKSEPIESAKEIFILNEAMKVMKLDEYNGYVKIRLPDGKLGWGNKNDFFYL